MLHRPRTRPRPIEHFDVDHTDETEILNTITRLGQENEQLRADVAAWRLRYYATAGSAGRIHWEPVVPEQREPPDGEQLPRTNRYQNLRLLRDER